jgi:hypothetical protein
MPAAGPLITQAGQGALTADEQGSMLRALPVALLLLFTPGEPSGAAVSAQSLIGSFPA